MTKDGKFLFLRSRICPYQYNSHARLHAAILGNVYISLEVKET